MKFKLLPLSAAVAFGIYPAMGLAQGSDEQNTVQEIMVTGKYSVARTLDTATGLGLTIQETPQSVSILTQERMKDQNIDTILKVVNNTVGVSSSEVDDVRNNFYSRGFRIDSYQIDGVPTSWSLGGDSGETVADTAIYERIEVVRGATGLLTGVGDPSASINLVRKHADSTELTGYVDVAAGRWDQRRFTADIASGLNESGSVRGRFVARDLSGKSNVNYYEDNKSVFYGVLEADVGADTLVRIGASYQNSDPESTVWGVLPAFFSDGTQIDWDTSKTTAMDWNRWETTNTNYFASINHTLGNGWELIANYNKLLYEKDTRLLYVYGTVDKETGGGLTAQRYRSDGESKQDSFDIQLKGDFNLFNQNHEFVLGALYSDQSADTFTQIPADQNPDFEYDAVPVENFYEWSGIQEPVWSDEREQTQAIGTEQRGYYAATRLSATDKLKFIVGGRIATWLRDGFDWSGNVDYGDEDEFIPYAGALYDLTDNHRVYASYTEIFKPQLERDANGQFLDPLVGKSTEVGLKSRFLNDRLHTTIALFDIEQDNLAQEDPDYDGENAEQPTAYYPAQGTESTGFELEVVGQPVDGWNVTAGYSQYNAEDAIGNDINTDQPTKQFKLFTTYQFLSTLPGLTIGGGVNWQDKTYSVGSNPVTQDAYSLVNLMARYEFTEAFSVQFNAANVTDEKYYSQVSSTSYRYGRPRDYTLSLNYRFD